MKPNQEISKLLRSIKRALWMIVAIMLIQLGFHLSDFKTTPFAEIIMLLGFWGGFFLFICLLIGICVGRPSKHDTHNPEAKPDDAP